MNRTFLCEWSLHLVVSVQSATSPPRWFPVSNDAAGSVLPRMNVLESCRSDDVTLCLMVISLQVCAMPDYFCSLVPQPYAVPRFPFTCQISFETSVVHAFLMCDNWFYAAEAKLNDGYGQNEFYTGGVGGAGGVSAGCSGEGGDALDFLDAFLVGDALPTVDVVDYDALTSLLFPVNERAPQQEASSSAGFDFCDFLSL